MYQLVKHLHGSPEDEALSNEESCWRCAAQNIIISYQQSSLNFTLQNGWPLKGLSVGIINSCIYIHIYIYQWLYIYIHIGTYLATAVVFEAKKNGDIPNHLAARFSGHFHAISKVKVLFSYLKQIFIGNFFRPKWCWKVREILPKIKNGLKMVDMVV